MDSWIVTILKTVSITRFNYSLVILDRSYIPEKVVFFWVVFIIINIIMVIHNEILKLLIGYTSDLLFGFVFRTYKKSKNRIE